MPKCEMLINCVLGEECRIAIVEDGRLEEIYQERSSAESHVGNIYKGRVVNVEPSIQAAFIEFGLERNGFLHITDLHPKYFPSESREQLERVGHKTRRQDRPPIQKCLRRGQEILVQIIKEGIGTKGPTLTSYLSIPGRFLVMMPDMERLGVSRKVEDEQTRREMRRLLEQLRPPKGFGFIVRTAGDGQTKTDLKRDLSYLQRLWLAIERRRKEKANVGELYAESDLVIRTIRDVFSPEIQRIVVDDPDAAKRASDFLAIANPRSASKVVVYSEPIPLYRRMGIEDQIENITRRTVELASGGSLVIDSTEAVVAIDVNSGKMRDNRDAETTAYKTNIEAADEICRQLRLRDLGGVIINDLIDMDTTKHRRAIEQRFRTNLKRDRARTRVAGISQFGILEMTRQRMRPSLKKSTYIDCPNCQGTGSVKSAESVLLDVMRRLATVLHMSDVARMDLTISPDVAFQLLNRKRSNLVALEHQYEKLVTVRVNDGGPIDYMELKAYDALGGAVDSDALGISSVPVMPSEMPPRLDAELETKPTFDKDELFEQRDEVVGQESLEHGQMEKASGTDMSVRVEPAEQKEEKPRRKRRGRRSRRTERDDSAAEPSKSVKKPDSEVEKPIESKPHRTRRDDSAAEPSKSVKKPDLKVEKPIESKPHLTKEQTKKTKMVERSSAKPAGKDASKPQPQPSSRGYTNTVFNDA